VTLPRRFRLLIVEDNPGDVRLAREALREVGWDAELVAVPDGLEALAYLRGSGGHGGAPRPDLVLLDLNLPRLDGRETLKALKEDPDLKGIPVIVFSSSRSEHDVIASYALHANGYVPKPASFDEFERVFRSIQVFWAGVAQLPTGGAWSSTGVTPGRTP